jgi:hypothetical protein
MEMEGVSFLSLGQISEINESGKVYCGSSFQKFQYMVSWLQWQLGGTQKREEKWTRDRLCPQGHAPGDTSTPMLYLQRCQHLPEVHSSLNPSVNPLGVLVINHLWTLLHHGPSF